MNRKLIGIAFHAHDENGKLLNNVRKLIEKMPKVYAPFRVKAKAGETFYQTFTGKGTLQGDEGPLYKLADISDGSSARARCTIC